MALFDFFKPKKKKETSTKSYTDTSSLAGVEKASRTSKPSLLGDLMMGFGLKEKDASYKIRTAETIRRNKEESEKKEKRRKSESDDRSQKRAESKGTTTKTTKAKPKQKTEEELYAEMKARELAKRRIAGKAKRKEYEQAVGKKVAARKEKMRLIML